MEIDLSENPMSTAAKLAWVDRGRFVQYATTAERAWVDIERFAASGLA